MWKQGILGKSVEATISSLPADHIAMKSFIDQYNKIQQQLETLAAIDDLPCMSIMKYYIDIDV